MTPAAGRRRRLVVVCTVGAAVVGASVLTVAIGGRRVDAEVARIVAAARTARIDPASLSVWALGPGPDPVTAALGTDAAPAAYERPDHTWCVSLRVERLLSNRSIHLVVALDGALTGIERCPGR